MDEVIINSFNKLYSYCKNQNWIGYDPFDGLNSRIFQSLPFFNSNKLFRLIFLQLNKRSAINFRSLLKIEKGRNPKGIGLFLTSFLNLYKKNKSEEYYSLINHFIRELKEDISPGYSGFCWGYNFDWQSRAFFLPKGTPTVVNTSFIGRAFLKAYEVLGDEEYLRIARSACDFILRDLNRLEDNKSLCFSYSPKDRYFVHNATALASSLLSKTYEKTGEIELYRIAKKSLNYVIKHQSNEGAWRYGEDDIARKTGIDSFHTGYILESLVIYSKSAQDGEYIDNIKKGLDFFQNHFFLDNGMPKYFYNKIFPIDIHCAAQGIITLKNLEEYGSNLVLCKKIIYWIINNMQDKEGYFYYQKCRFFTIKIPYMRWIQAWIFHALSSYFTSDK